MSPSGAPATSALMLTLRRRSKRVICAEPLPISSAATVPRVTLWPLAAARAAGAGVEVGARVEGELGADREAALVEVELRQLRRVVADGRDADRRRQVADGDAEVGGARQVGLDDELGRFRPLGRRRVADARTPRSSRSTRSAACSSAPGCRRRGSRRGSRPTRRRRSGSESRQRPQLGSRARSNSRCVSSRWRGLTSETVIAPARTSPLVLEPRPSSCAPLPIVVRIFVTSDARR
jgi:hypothetical protein